MSQWPGVSVTEFNWYTGYDGKLDALIATGLFCLEWFPGHPGNGKTSSTFVFTDDTERNGYIKRPKARQPRESSYGYVSIRRYGQDKYYAYRYYSTAEIERRKLEKAACTGADEWQRAKDARTDKGETLALWRNAISYRIAEIERLCAGEAYFSEMPDVRIKGDDLARVRDAVESLRRAFALTTPEMPDVVIRSNVYSIRDGAHRGLKKTG